MKFDIPSDVWEKVLSAKKKKEEKKQEKVQREKERKEKADKELTLRMNDKENVETACNIINWFSGLIQSKKGSQILESCGHLGNHTLVICAKYFHGEPVPDSDRASSCSVYLHKGEDDGKWYLTCKDKYMWHPSSEGENIDIFGVQPELIVKQLHPGLIKEIWVTIENGKIWENIKNSIQ